VRVALRAGVRFHDGAPFTAAAVVQAWRRALVASGRAGLGRFTLLDLAGARAVVADSTADWPGAVAVDSVTLLLRLEAPNPDFMAGVGGSNELIPAPTSTPARPIGTGPWRVASRDATARIDHLEAYAAHWTPPMLPALDVVYGAPGREPATVADGRIDYIRLPPFVGARGALATEGVARSAPLLRMQLAVHNQLGGLRDPRAREALAAAMDLEAIERELGDSTFVVATGPLPPALAGGAGHVVRYDPARSRALLAALPAPLPRPLHLWYEAAPDSFPSIRFVGYVVAALEAVGVAVERHAYTDVAQVRRDSLAALVFAPIQPNQLDPRAYLAGFRPGPVDLPLSVGFSDVEADTLLQGVMTAPDAATRAARAVALHGVLADLVPAVFLWYQPVMARYNLAYAGVTASPFRTRFLSVRRR
jgi:ABC-type transport system substrate-binding protein